MKRASAVSFAFFFSASLFRLEAKATSSKKLIVGKDFSLFSRLRAFEADRRVGTERRKNQCLKLVISFCSGEIKHFPVKQFFCVAQGR